MNKILDRLNLQYGTLPNWVAHPTEHNIPPQGLYVYTCIHMSWRPDQCLRIHLGILHQCLQIVICSPGVWEWGQRLHFLVFACFVAHVYMAQHWTKKTPRGRLLSRAQCNLSENTWQLSLCDITSHVMHVLAWLLAQVLVVRTVSGQPFKGECTVSPMNCKRAIAKQASPRLRLYAQRREHTIHVRVRGHEFVVCNGAIYLGFFVGRFCKNSKKACPLRKH